MPERIQLSRRKGWRKPENTVVVARPSKWGNPFRVGSHSIATGAPMTRGEAVSLFRIGFDRGQSWRLPYPTNAEVRAELEVKNLACWCPLDQPCHADVLLEIANAPTPGPDQVIGPDCRDGKHRACDGRGFDLVADEIITCACACHEGNR